MGKSADWPNSPAFTQGQMAGLRSIMVAILTNAPPEVREQAGMLIEANLATNLQNDVPEAFLAGLTATRDWLAQTPVRPPFRRA